MLIDNCPAHPKIENLRAIKLKFLPPNTTSCLQPMDQGIIQNLKVLYRRLIVERILQAVEAGQTVDNSTITLLDAVRMLHLSWHQVKAQTISNCFQHAGFKVQEAADNQMTDVLPTATEAAVESVLQLIAPEARNIWDRLRSVGFNIPADVAFDDFYNADNELAVNETLTDKVILGEIARSSSTTSDGAPVAADDNDDDDVDDSSEHRIVTTSEAKTAVGVLRDWFESNGIDSGFNALAQLECAISNFTPLQQSSITDYFKKSSVTVKH